MFSVCENFRPAIWRRLLPLVPAMLVFPSMATPAEEAQDPEIQLAETRHADVELQGAESGGLELLAAGADGRGLFEISPLRPAKGVLSCREDEEIFCYRDRRFSVQIEWFLETGESGSARRISQDFPSQDSGLFYFFAEDNWELLLKVLDGCSFNNRFWIFAAAASNVGYTLRIVDTEAALERTYTKPAGVVAPSLTDVFALPTCDPDAVPRVDMTPDEFLIFAGESTGVSLQTYDDRGSPLAGQRVELATDLGSVEPAEVTTDEQGSARFLYRADPVGGRSALLTARVANDDGLGAVSRLEIAVASRPAALALEADWVVIPSSGTSFIFLSATVVDGNGQRLPGWPVTFSAELGEFPDGEIQVTNGIGVANTTFFVDADDLIGVPGSFEITATVDGVGGPVSDRVTIQVVP